MKKITTAMVIGICLTMSIIAGFPTFGEAATIYGCYMQSSGSLRIVSGPDNCRKPETPISWNQAGFDRDRVYIKDCPSTSVCACNGDDVLLTGGAQCPTAYSDLYGNTFTYLLERSHPLDLDGAGYIVWHAYCVEYQTYSGYIPYLVIANEYIHLNPLFITVTCYAP
ncbi:MAG: hypothetical protein M1508_02045 [Nitrospirae bacterium]|nr:hypothetical protein [Nitrospirota bacterium]